MATKNKVVLSISAIVILAGGLAIANAVKKGGSRNVTTVCEDTNGDGKVECRTSGGEGAGPVKTECTKKGTGIECRTTVK
jgi:hypothetical protein